MQLCALPALADNYIWVLHNGREAIVCDPAEAEVVISALQRWQLALAAILITHHHDDHIGGVNELYRQCGTPATQVYLPAADGLSPQAFPAISPQALRPCRQGDSVQLPGLRLEVLDVPGHTAGHIAFYAAAVQFAAPVREARRVAYMNIVAAGMAVFAAALALWASL